MAAASSLRRESFCGSSSLLAAAAKRVQSAPGRRKMTIANGGGWGSAVASASAVSRSVHADAISQIDDLALKGKAVTLVTSQEGCVKARADGVMANDDALTELKETFRTRADDAMLARVPMNRVTKSLQARRCSPLPASFRTLSVPLPHC